MQKKRCTTSNDGVPQQRYIECLDLTFSIATMYCVTPFTSDEVICSDAILTNVSWRWESPWLIKSSWWTLSLTVHVWQSDLQRRHFDQLVLKPNENRSRHGLCAPSTHPCSSDVISHSFWEWHRPNDLSWAWLTDNEFQSNNASHYSSWRSISNRKLCLSAIYVRYSVSQQWCIDSLVLTLDDTIAKVRYALSASNAVICSKDASHLSCWRATLPLLTSSSILHIFKLDSPPALPGQ